MKTITHLFTRGVFVTLLVFLAALGTSSGQTYTLSTANCTTTSNSFEFDVMVTNTNASTDLRMNGTVIRGNLPAALIASGTNTIAFSFVNDGQSIIPNSFPPNSVITFSYTAASRQFSTSTLNTVYNNNTCSAPLIAPGTTAKIGRFRLLNSTNNFAAGQNATFTWATGASIIAYANCNTSTALALVRTVVTPCSVPIPSSCAISASIQSQIDVLCFGGTGFATATSTGGVEPVTYSWNTTPPQSGATASGLLPGTYVVTATGANACSATASVTITGPASALVASASQDSPILCNGGSTTVTVSATGGTAPYTGTGTFPASAGSNTYTVTDANGCTTSSTVEVTQPSPLVLSLSHQNALCFGESTGSITAVGSGGTAPYTYSISSLPFQPSGVFGGLASGNYFVDVKDANGCVTGSTITVGQPVALTASATSTPTSTPVSSDGTALVSANGGTTPYTITWNTIPVQTGAFASGLAAGTYIATIVDQNGCTTTTSVTVTSPSCALLVSATHTDVSCFGGTNGTATASSTGGTGVVNYTIMPGGGSNTTGLFTGLASGIYTITGVDENLCSSSATVTVGSPTELVGSSSATAIACNGGTSTVTVSATGGTLPYSGTGSFSETAGTYTYTVTDANGCTATTTVTITEPSAVVASSSATAILCFGGSSTVTVSATGGTAPYSGTGSFSEVAGTYTYTVTDANGCTATTTITISQPAASVVASATQDAAILCNGGTTTVTVSATGGTTPYSGAGTFTVGAGTYTYTVTDANGCSSSTTITVTEPSAVVASSSATAILCNGGSSTVTVSATGGTAPYSGTGSFSVTAGTYTYTVTDANGCTATTSVTVTEPAALVASASAQGTIACFGGSASVDVTATGGTAPYSGTGTFSQFAGTITYTVTDANGCTSTSSVTLTEPAKVEGTTTTTASSCAGSDGTATVTATGGTGAYSYLWSNGQTSATATGLAIGAYTVVITDANGCTGSATATVGGSGGSPTAPGAIAGPAGACRNTSGIVFSVAAVPGASSYIWTLPSGATGSSTTNSITVAFGSTYGGGFICVAAVNTCGTSATSCMNIPVITVYPGQPSVIVGPAAACAGGTYTYSTTSANALSYTWTVTGTGVAIVSGQGTNTVQVSVPAGFGQGSVQVRGVNCNGISAVRGMTITGTPTHSNTIAGPNFVCANGTATYTMPIVTGATAHVWSVSGNATVVSQTTTSTTTSATINFGPTWTSGIVTVSASNSCGSFARSFTVNSTPTQPGSITGPGSGLCGLTGVTYSIAAVAGATSYTWSVPAGVTIVSTAPSGLSIVVDFTPAFVSNSAPICVSASNSCGTGPARCFTVTSRPSAPVITGPASVCKSNSAVVYTASAVASATSYSWSVTGGASIAPAGSSATVNFNTALSTTAVVRVNAINACGASQPGAKTVAVSLFCRTAADDVTVSNTELGAYPNPTSGKATVSFNAASESKYLVKVTDMIGNALVSDVVNAIEGYNTQDIDLTGVAKGIYMISVTAADGSTETIRLVVE